MCQNITDGIPPNVLNISVLNAPSIGNSFVAAVLLCVNGKHHIDALKYYA